MSSPPSPGRPIRALGRRRAPTGLLILIALLLAVALERAGGHARTPPLAAVAFSDARRGFGFFVAQGSSRCVASSAATADGGAHFGKPVVLAGWRCAGTPSVSQIAADGRGDAFAYGPALIATHDGGRTWTPAQAPGAVLAIAAAGASVWMVTRDCGGVGAKVLLCPMRALASADGGRDWKPTAAQPPGAAAARGEVGAQSAYGQTWLLRTGRSSGYVLSSPRQDGTVTAILHTADGGTTWARRSLPCATHALTTVLAAAPHDTLVAVCAGQPSAGSQAKSLAVSTDGGRSWSQPGPCGRDPATAACTRSPLSQGYLGDAVATSAQTVYVIGDRSGLVITRDGGRRWKDLGATVGDIDGTPAQVAFFGPRDGIVLGRENTSNGRIAIWHTADEGRHWSAVIPSAAS